MATISGFKTTALPLLPGNTKASSKKDDECPSNISAIRAIEPWRAMNSFAVCPQDSSENLKQMRAETLARELTAIIDGDRYFLSPPFRRCEIRNMIRPEPEREPLALST